MKIKQQSIAKIISSLMILSFSSTSQARFILEGDTQPQTIQESRSIEPTFDNVDRTQDPITNDKDQLIRNLQAENARLKESLLNATGVKTVVKTVYVYKKAKAKPKKKYFKNYKNKKVKKKVKHYHKVKPHIKLKVKA